MYERAAQRLLQAQAPRQGPGVIAPFDGSSSGGPFAPLEQALRSLGGGSQDDDGQLFQGASSRAR
eukprot:15163627-Heterocapsa_arctica.AAC.1